MDWHDALSAAGLLFGLAGAALGIRRHDAKKREAEALARDAQGRRYAELGWAYARQQPDVDRRGAARRHAIAGFIIADTALDGHRDFTDKQVGAYVDAAKPSDMP